MRTCTVPAKPRWLLSIPAAISQLEQLDRTLHTRRDIERLFGVGKVRAAALMQTFGAELVGNQRTLPRTKLLQQLKKHLEEPPGRVERRAESLRERVRSPSSDRPLTLRGAVMLGSRHDEGEILAVDA